MRSISVPAVAYGKTAVRPGWLDLPESLREAISAQLGAPITSVQIALGGFTRAFAAVITVSGGRRAFVKAAKTHSSFPYAREAAITDSLPPEIIVARPRWTLVESGYFVLCLDAIDGHVPPLPWSPAHLSAALHAWSTAAQALAKPPPKLLAAGLPALPDILRAEMSFWSAIESGHEPFPAAAHGLLSAPGPLPAAAPVSAPGLLSAPGPLPAAAPVSAPGLLSSAGPGTVVAARLSELATLERALPPLAAGGGMLHGDLRVDNILIDRDGSARLCDWTWPCLGAFWFDTVTLLVSAYASGLDVDAYLKPWNAPAAGIDGALAALSGYWLVHASGGPSSASPHSRQHQLFSGTQALAWLAERRGWS